MKKRLPTCELLAHEAQKKSRRRFKPKRKTVLVRIQEKWRTPLRNAAQHKKKTLSKLHDEIYPFYFKHKADDG